MCRGPAHGSAAHEISWRSSSHAGDTKLGGSALTALRIGWAVLASASGAAGAAVGELLLFHARLRCLGLSTYEFVLRQRARRARPDSSSPRHEHSPEPSASGWGGPMAVLGGDQELPKLQAGAKPQSDPAVGEHDGHLDPAAAASCAACGLPRDGAGNAAHRPFYRAFPDEPSEEGGSAGASGLLAGACAADSVASCSGPARREADGQGHRTGDRCSDVESSRASARPFVRPPSAGALFLPVSTLYAICLQLWCRTGRYM